MTNPIALGLAALILAALVADAWFGWGAALFLARRLAALIGWLAVWR